MPGHNDHDKTGGKVISPPEFAGFPGLAGLVLVSPASGKDRKHNASMSLEDQAEWLNYDWFINLNSLLKIILLIATVYNLSILASRRIRTVLCINNDVQAYFRWRRTGIALWKQHLLYPTVFGPRKRRWLRYSSRPSFKTMPTRIELLTAIGYIGANIAFNCIGINWKHERKVVLEQLRNRTGILAIENMVPAYLFIMRSNPVAWFSGSSREQLAFLHRWFSYVAVAQTLVHAGLWMACRILYDGWNAMNNSSGKHYLWTAWMAIAALLCLMVTSTTAFRNAFYQLFGNLHSFFSLIFLVGIYLHLDGHEYQKLVMAIVVLWALERAFRIVYVLWRNLGKSSTMAIVEALPGSTLRMTITCVRPCGADAGRYIYLWVPSISWWMSHPYVAGWDNIPFDEDMMWKFPIDEQMEMEKAHAKNLVWNQGRLERKTITLLIRQQKGFTDKLARRVEAANGRLELKVWVEGPYDNTVDNFKSHGHIVLLAGGMGITAQCARVGDILSRRARGLAVARRIILIWCVRYTAHIEWIKPFIRKVRQSSVHQGLIQIKVFVTDEEEYSGSSSFQTGSLKSFASVVEKRIGRVMDWGKEVDVEEFELPIFRPDSMIDLYAVENFDLIEVNYGRPSIERLVEVEMRQQIGAMMLSVCGPPSMSNEARRVAVEVQKRANVDFIDEDFTM